MILYKIKIYVYVYMHVRMYVSPPPSPPLSAGLLLTIITFRYSGSRYRFGLYNSRPYRSSHKQND